MSLEFSREAETAVRKTGLPIFWRLEDGRDPRPLFERFQDFDGVIVTGEYVMENPYILAGLTDLISSRNGRAALLEMQPKKSRLPFSPKLKERLLKTHLLASRETLNPSPEAWRARLVRAVRERAVQLLFIRMSPSLTLEENARFQASVAEALSAAGAPAVRPTPYWENPDLRSNLSALPTNQNFIYLCLLAAILAPLAALAFLVSPTRGSPILLFLVACVLSTTAGLAVHGLGSSYETIVGLKSMRGIKLQLIVPLLLSVFILLPKNRYKKFGASPILWNQAAIAGAVLVVLGGLYLARSGNFPLLPASGTERHFRDWMEGVLGARPRFKEFAIGHPLMILGLYARQKWGRDMNLFKNGTLFLWIGVIGQISILNTFTHFHSPLTLGLLRTLHGVWIGTLLAVPLCYVASFLWKTPTQG